MARIEADLSRVTEELEWKDIGSEAFRTYYFIKDSELAFITIDTPLKLHVSASGGHRIIDVDGGSWYIPSGWIALYWEGFDDGVAQYDF